MTTFTERGHKIQIFNVKRGLDEGYMAKCMVCREKIAGPTTMTLIRRQITSHVKVKI